ncbi:hypothetical protein ABIE89_007223 [Bradyrhizobium niftali]|jgi:hypothetical protein
MVSGPKKHQDLLTFAYAIHVTSALDGIVLRLPDRQF